MDGDTPGTDDKMQRVATGGDAAHPAPAAVGARHAEFAAVGFMGAEKPTGEEAH